MSVNYRSVTMYQAIISVLLVTLANFRPVAAGSCWMSVSSNGRCQMPLAGPQLMAGRGGEGEGETVGDVSREECCAAGGPSAAWTPHSNVSRSQMFLWLYISGGAPDCKPCRDNSASEAASCEGVQCGTGMRCRVRHGAPQCVCAPDCSQHRAEYGSGPLCGSDLRTYRNYCHMLKSNCRKGTYVQVNYKGRCRYSCSDVECSSGEHCVLDQNAVPHCIPCMANCPPAGATRAGQQICGADGITYPSLCHFRYATCLHGRSIGIAYSGMCRENVTCEDVAGLCRWGQQCLVHPVSRQPQCVTCDHCNARISGTDPLCATDGHTYRGWCAILNEACRTGVVLETKHYGPCGEPPSEQEDIYESFSLEMLDSYES